MWEGVKWSLSIQGCRITVLDMHIDALWLLGKQDWREDQAVELVLSLDWGQTAPQTAVCFTCESRRWKADEGDWDKQNQQPVLSEGWETSLWLASPSWPGADSNESEEADTTADVWESRGSTSCALSVLTCVASWSVSRAWRLCSVSPYETESQYSGAQTPELLHRQVKGLHPSPWRMIWASS